jgi:hypothetical protein
MTPHVGTPLREETRIASIGPPMNAPPKLNVSATKPVVSTVPAPVETAADKARRKREAEKNVWSALQYRWEELPKPARRGVIAAFSLLVLAGGGFGLYAAQAPKTVSRGPEPRELNFTDTMTTSFGHGLGVDFERPLEKGFTFQFASPTETALLVQLRGQSIGKDEVAVLVNGNEVGFLPEDFGIPTRELEMLVPQRVLLKGNENTLVFENRKTTDGSEPWRISDIRLELLTIPPGTPDEALAIANKLAKQASDQLLAKEPPTQNIYKAWRWYREVWVHLLGSPEDKRPPLFAEARRKHAELGKELDQRCGGYLLEAKKQMELHNPDRAREILEEVPLHFPGKEHRCQTLARQKIEDYDL